MSYAKLLFFLLMLGILQYAIFRITASNGALSDAMRKVFK